MISYSLTSLNKGSTGVTIKDQAHIELSACFASEYIYISSCISLSPNSEIQSSRFTLRGNGSEREEALRRKKI